MNGEFWVSEAEHAILLISLHVCSIHVSLKIFKKYRNRFVTHFMKFNSNLHSINKMILFSI